MSVLKCIVFVVAIVSLESHASLAMTTFPFSGSAYVTILPKADTEITQEKDPNHQSSNVLFNLGNKIISHVKTKIDTLKRGFYDYLQTFIILPDTEPDIPLVEGNTYEYKDGTFKVMGEYQTKSDKKGRNVKSEVRDRDSGIENKKVFNELTKSAQEHMIFRKRIRPFRKYSRLKLDG